MSALRRTASIAGNELRRLLRERLARTLGGLGALIVLLSLGLGFVREAQTAERQKAYAARADQDWSAQPDRHPHRVVHAGDFVFKTPGPLARIDWGIESQVGRSVFLEGHRQNTANFSDAALSGGLLRLGDLSPSLVVQQWLPLLVLLAGAASLAGERQSGVLATSVIGGARGAELLLGKAAALWAFGGLMAAPVFIALLWTAVAQPELAARAAGLVASFAAVLALAALGTVLVSSLARSVLGALLASVVAWFALVAVAPRAVASAAELAAPAPAQAEVEQRIAAALAKVGDAHDPNSAPFAAFRQRVLNEYGVARVEDLPVNFGGLVMLEGERLTTDAIAAEVDRQYDAWQAQVDATAVFAWIAPTLAVRHAAQAFAGTDLSHHRDFLQQAEKRRFTTVQALNELHATKIAALNDRDQKLDASHWAGIPRTGIALPTLRQAAPNLMANVAPVGLWLLLGVVGAVGLGRRLERRA
jgi:ABC-2 type transport system permease protein